MPVVQQGAINTTALIVPDLYVQIVPPSVYLLNGLPTNIAGIVGTASWGPVNSPTIASAMSDYASQFGPIMPRKYDMGTAVAAAVLQGANNFRCVRVTDGTDTAANTTIQTNCLTATARYTGSQGNGLQFIISTGSQANTWRVTIVLSGIVPEQFDNLAAGVSGNAVWQAIATAVNSGINGLRGPSNLMVLSAGSGTAAPQTGTYSLSGGTDGANISSGNLLGQDAIPRKGMYALRNSFASVAMLTDCDDSTTWSTQVAYGFSEGTYMQMVGPAGDTISNAAATKASAGIDAYIAKLLFGDWIYFKDTVNGGVRLISPQGYYLGLLANLSPQNSGLNKQIRGIVGTQKSIQNQVYSGAELQAFAQAGIDIITNPVPGGNYFGPRFGRNTSSNAVINGDNYTRMTNYIAYTLNAGMGYYVGRLNEANPPNPSLPTTVEMQAGETLSSFLDGMQTQKMIGPYGVKCDPSNNPSDRVGLGYLQADCQVQYLAVVQFFIVNMEGGQSVNVTIGQTQSA